MASDLSQLIQDSISNTLNGLLAKETKLIETTKVHEKDIQDLEILQVNVVFDFEKISSTLSFAIPGTSASFIFNSMMGDRLAETIATIDDDTKDAMEEFISNLAGGLVTTINGSDLPDLGNVKFSIAKSQVIKGNELPTYDNMFRFLLDLEGHQLEVFTQFDKILLPFIATLMASEITKHEEPVIEEVVEEPEVIEAPKEEVKEEKTEEKTEEAPKDKKIGLDDKKIKLIVMGLGGLIALLLVSGIVMYFMGVFDEPEPVVVKVVKKVKKDEVDIIKYKTLKKVNFKTSDIDTKRLNGRLALLNKSSILTPSQLSKENLEEKKRLEALDIEKEYIEFAKNNKEEPIEDKPKQKIIKNKPKQKSIKALPEMVKKVKEEVKIEKLKYIIANSLQYKLFSQLLTKTGTTTASASICSNENGETVIFIGPFETDNTKNKMDLLINQSDSNIETKIDNITKEQFSQYCNM